MKRILLTHGKYALVDDADYEWLNQWRWHAHFNKYTFYARRRTSKIEGQKLLLMHRLILNAQKGQEIDHRNTKGYDNQRCNLRFCTHTQNVRNKRLSSKGSSRFKGVDWRKDRGKWRANIKAARKPIFLGHFSREIDAAKAYDRKAKELFGDFARLNFK